MTEIDELREKAAKATPGPWSFVPWHIEEGPSAVRVPAGWLLCNTSGDANAAYIAAASPDVILRLLDQFDALSSRTSNEAVVRVKPLEWRKNFESEFLSWAETIVGRYRVWSHHEADGKWFWELSGDRYGFSSANSEAEAKSAAQSDYEQRIRSALVSGSAVPGEDGWQQSHLDRALDFIEWLTADPLLDGDDIEMTLEDVQEHARIELSSIKKAIANKSARSNGAAVSARFARLDGICSRILWTDYGVPALENEMTKAALRDLADYLFAAGIDKAVSAAPPLSQPVLRPDAISEQSSVGEE